jgi:hypothetical protein
VSENFEMPSDYEKKPRMEYATNGTPSAPQAAKPEPKYCYFCGITNHATSEHASPSSSTERDELVEADIIEQLLGACNGHPYAKIPWPHRVLHNAVNEILRLRRALAAQGGK